MDDSQARNTLKATPVQTTNQYNSFLNPVMGQLSRPLLSLIRAAALLTLASCAAAPSHQPAAKENGSSSRKQVSAPHASSVDSLSGREAAAWLTEADAIDRSARIKNIHYALKFDFDRTGDDFKGEEILRFELSQSSKPLTLDFEEGQIESVTNTKTQQPVVYQYTRHFLTFSGGSLNEGSNSIHIKYHRPYSKSGDGLYRFQDPEDHEVYVYSDFEPYHANNLFPCFDQPDLKATYQLTATVPQDWTVTSSTRETGVQPAGTKFQTWVFPNSKLFSTYLFSVVAGPFQVWSDKAGDIPIRLMSRKSLAKYVLHDEWLLVTKQGLEFYQKYFDFKFPFLKYDQVIVPDFNAGAMENVADATFSEHYVNRGVSTDIEKENLAGVILHEMAHMWFGDLVTMKWWNGLWLNESFATFMSSEASRDATRFKSSWETFHLGRKQWGYLEDQFVTTHPIETPVESTDVAESNFDGITYAKGASVLKQLNFYLTPEKFRAGVRLYFKKYKFSNTTTEDFFGAMSEASGQKLNDWTSLWLKTAGLNTVSAQFTCKDGKVEHLSLLQSGEAGFTQARPHRFNLALIQQKPLSINTIDVILADAKVEVEAAKGQACPALVLPNFGDQDYLKVQLDEVSRQNLGLVLDESQSLDAMTRSQLWTTYWDSVRDGKIAAEEFLIRAESALKIEHDERISDFLLNSLVHSRSVTYLRSALFYLPNESSRTAWRLRLEHALSEMLKRPDLSADLRKSVYDSYIRVVISEDGLKQIFEALQAKKRFLSVEIDQDRRWNTLAQLARNQVAGVDAAIAAEKKSDPSHSGHLMAIATEVVIPQLAAKEAWLNRFIQDTTISAADVRSASTWMFPDEQDEIFQQELPRVRESVDALAKNRESSYVDNAIRGLLPIDGRVETVQFLQSWWNHDHGWLPSMVERGLRVAIQENNITMRNRKVVASPVLINQAPASNPSTNHP